MATFTEASMLSAEEDSTSSPDEDPYDDTDILNSAGTDEVTAHLAAAGMHALSPGRRRSAPGHFRLQSYNLGGTHSFFYFFIYLFLIS